MAVYIFILVSKIIENGLATLRMIFVSNGKKMIGAVLQLVTSLIWIFSTSIVLIDIDKDILKIVAFALGSFLGSYLGCQIEEKLAIGSNMITAIIDEENKQIIDIIRNHGFAVTTTKGTGINSTKEILLIVTSRKKRKKIVKLIKDFDGRSLIISENATPIHGGHI